MIIDVVNESDLRKILKKLIVECDKINFAVAWGSAGEMSDILIKNKNKFESVVFGLNKFATDPELVERLIGVKNAFIVKSRHGIFHPKIYLFKKGNEAEAIIGSANFTEGGLERNREACLHIRGAAKEEIFNQIRKELSRHYPLRQKVTSDIARAYRIQYDIAHMREVQVDPVLPNDREARGLTSALVRLDWDTFVSKVKRDPKHHFKRRLELLREIQRLFAGAETFADLSIAEWKGIAGTLRPLQAESQGLGHHDWGWFGSMGGNGSFAHLVSIKDSFLGEALDCIPRKDTVTRQQFDEYCRKFRYAFERLHSRHTGGYPTATRLLAMKRPDTFVCMNGKNRKNLARALNFPVGGLSLEKYWDLVVVPIQASSWYNAPRPSGSDSELWDYRAAMLDAIYFDESA